MNSIWFDVANRGLMFAMLAVSANLVLGTAGQLSLATAGFFGIGSYTSAILTGDHGWSFPAGAAAAMVVCAIVGAVLALPILRVQGEYVVLLTLAFLSVVNQMESSWIGLTGGATGKFPIPPVSLFGWEPATPWDFLPLNIVLLVVVLALSAGLVASPYGRVLRAVRDDPVATRAVGANVFRYQVSVFAISGALAGLVGAVWAAYFAFITPSSFGLEQTIFIAALVVLGGLGNLWGATIAAFVLVALPEVLRKLDLGADHSFEIQQAVYGAALIAFMLFRPQGIFRERVREPGATPHGRRDAAEVDELVARMRTPGADAPATTAGQAGGVLLEARGVSKSFGGVHALVDVSIELRAGTITALIGPNGAGKTTLFNVLTGDLDPDAGHVVCGGEDITGRRTDQIVALGVARSFQDVRLFPSMSAHGNVAVAIRGQSGATLVSLVLHPIRSFRQRREVTAKADDLLDHVGFVADRTIAVTELGYGEQKLVALARLLATEPEVVLLDEPSSGTDAVWVQRVVDIIERLARSGVAVCIVEHNLDLIRRLEGTAYFLDEGRIVARGTVAELMGERQLLESYLGLT